MEKVDKYGEEIFENIKHINEYGQEFWYARELQDILQYTQWRRLFEKTGNPIAASDLQEKNKNIKDKLDKAVFLYYEMLTFHSREKLVFVLTSIWIFVCIFLFAVKIEFWYKKLL